MNKEIYPESYVDVKSISPNWVTDNFLDFMNLKLEDCKWKNSWREKKFSGILEALCLWE